MSDPHESGHARAESRVGETLHDKWHLDRLLGVGGMAAVYAATHRNGKRAAVKVLHPELSMEGEIRTRFLREGYAANKVAHPGAVSVLDDDVTENGTVFLVMELLEGESLAARADRCHGVLEAGEVFQIAERLLDVIAAAHAQGIVHRDLKPDNIFIGEDGSVKVLDFGIARLRETADSGVTKTGLAMGTPAFMPPEQARGRWSDVDGRSDLWAIGATMYSLLVGRPVHVADTMNEVLLAAMTLPARPIGELFPGLPPSAQEAVDRALAYEREGRWPDARTMQAAVRAAYEELRGSAADAAVPLVVPTRGSASAPTIPAQMRAPALTTARAVTGIGATPPVRPKSSGGKTVLAIFVLAACGVGAAWWLEGQPSLAQIRDRLRNVAGALAPETSASVAPSASVVPSTSASAAPAASSAPPVSSGRAIAATRPDDGTPAWLPPSHKTTPAKTKGKGKGK